MSYHKKTRQRIIINYSFQIQWVICNIMKSSSHISAIADILTRFNFWKKCYVGDCIKWAKL